MQVIDTPRLVCEMSPRSANYKLLQEEFNSKTSQKRGSKPSSYVVLRQPEPKKHIV
jgi:hypothetical protein